MALDSSNTGPLSFVFRISLPHKHDLNERRNSWVS